MSSIFARTIAALMPIRAIEAIQTLGSYSCLRYRDSKRTTKTMYLYGKSRSCLLVCFKTSGRSDAVSGQSLCPADTNDVESWNAAPITRRGRLVRFQDRYGPTRSCMSSWMLLHRPSLTRSRVSLADVNVMTTPADIVIKSDTCISFDGWTG